MSKAAAVSPDRFSFDGRGPEITHAHWELAGQSLVAIDYTNRGGNGSIAGSFHVTLMRFQVVMITPEEVIGGSQLPDNAAELRPAALYDLGKSEWMKSFFQHHLTKCRHYKLLFYDELFDIICEGVEVHRGSYSVHNAV